MSRGLVALPVVMFQKTASTPTLPHNNPNTYAYLRNSARKAKTGYKSKALLKQEFQANFLSRLLITCKSSSTPRVAIFTPRGRASSAILDNQEIPLYLLFTTQDS
jgi:hypothetical protein